MPSKTTKKPSSKAAAKKGLTPKTFKGLNQKRMEQAGRGQGKRVRFSDNEPTVTLQFMQTPDDFMEFQVHFFQEDGRWNVVPCAGKDDCPLCEAEDDKISGTSYRFAANVLNLKTGKVQVLEGPQALALRIFSRYKRAPSKFLKRVYDVSKLPTKPVNYDMEVAEEDAVSTRGKKLFDLEEYLVEEMKAYYGDDLDITPGSLSDDDEDEGDEDVDEEEEDDEEDDDEEDDEDSDDDDEEEDDEDDEEDDEDEDDEDDEDEEEDEPPAKKRAPAKKAAAAKKPAAKSKKTTSKRK